MNALPHLDKRFLGSVLTCVGLTALAVQPLAAHAANLYPVTTSGGTVGKITRGGSPHGTTMHESYRVFPGGTKVPGSGSTTSVLVKGSKAAVTAQATISGSVPGTAYRFIFWDIGGHLYTHRTARFVAPAHQAAFKADAWYIPEGGGPCPIPAGCTTGVTAYGFSLLKHKTLPGSPIASVVPSSAQTGPNTVSTATAITLTAVNPVELVRWLAPGATVEGTQLAAGAGVSTVAIAFYGPNPCQGIQNEIDGLSAADFPPPNPVKEYQIAVRALLSQLRACEARHGG